MTCAACLSSAAPCAAHADPLRAIVDALPRCVTCEANGRDRHATRYERRYYSRVHLCDEHSNGAEVPYAAALRAAGLA